MRSVYVAGGVHTPFIGKFHPDFIWKKHPDFGLKENPDTEGYLRMVGEAMGQQFGIDGSEFQRAYVGNFVGELFDNQGHLGAMVAATMPGLSGVAIGRLEGACASGGLAMAAGVDAIRAGADLVYVVGAEVQTTRNAIDGADFLARASHYKRQRSIDPFTFPALFAARIQQVVKETETTLDDLALASVKAYANANRNPFAHMHTVKMPFEKASVAGPGNPHFLSNLDLHPWMRVSDCSQVSDGASAIILASEVGLKTLNRTLSDTIEVMSCVGSTASIAVDADPLRLSNIGHAANGAYAEAGISPQDIDVAEVHDCFTVAEILSYEALGFAEEGQGSHLLRDGATSIDGRLPVNTGGGLVGFGHPVGATGVKQALEIWRQSKGMCGAYQIPNTPTYGISANMGGDDRTAVVTIYRNHG
jgi:acetyl-CoA acyltransferase